MDGQAVAVLGHAPEPVDVGHVELGVDALGEEVHGQGDDVHIARALAVAEQRALDPIGAGQHPELGGGHRAAAVVVRVQGQHEAVAVARCVRRNHSMVSAYRFGVYISTVAGRFNDDLRSAVGSITSMTASQISTANSTSVPVIALGRVLVEDLGVAHRLLELPAQLGGIDRDVDDARLVEAEHDPPLEDRTWSCRSARWPAGRPAGTRRSGGSARAGTARAPGW